MNALFLKIAACVGAVIIGFGSRFLLKKKPDNQIEELAEYVIKKQTGIDIDLSPDTPDKDFNLGKLVVETKDIFNKKKSKK